jgi:hypothetical protein
MGGIGDQERWNMQVVSSTIKYDSPKGRFRAAIDQWVLAKDFFSQFCGCPWSFFVQE